MSHRVLVTGAFGNVGSRTVHHLLTAGHHVEATDLPTAKTQAIAAGFGDAVEIVWGNICDPQLWPQLLVGIDTVIHLAAVIPPTSDHHPELATAVNLTATAEMLRCMEASPTAKRLIFASSMAVAGFHGSACTDRPLWRDQGCVRAVGSGERAALEHPAHYRLPAGRYQL